MTYGIIHPDRHHPMDKTNHSVSSIRSSRTHKKVTPMVMDDRITLPLFQCPSAHFWNKAISIFDLENSRSRSWIWSKRQSRTVSLVSSRFASFSFRIALNQTNSWGTAISKFDLENSKVKVKVMGEVKVQGHIFQPVSNRSTSFLFHVFCMNHSWYMVNRAFDLDKMHLLL